MTWFSVSIHPALRKSGGTGHRVLVISDTHGNKDAFDKTIEHAQEHGGFHRVVIAGDIGGYGADTDHIVSRLKEFEDRGIPVTAVAGNHEHAMLDKDHVVNGENHGPVRSKFNPSAAKAAKRAGRALSPETRDYLDKLPETATFKMPGVPHGSFAVAHGTVHDPIMEYSDTVSPAEQFAAMEKKGIEAHHLIVGHTHKPHVEVLSPTGVPVPDDDPEYHQYPEYKFGPPHHERATYSSSKRAFPEGVPFLSTVDGRGVREGERMIVNPGSVGQPRDGDSRASYAILHSSVHPETGHHELDTTFHRVPYDISHSLARIRESGLPEENGLRLAIGR